MPKSFWEVAKNNIDNIVMPLGKMPEMGVLIGDKDYWGKGIAKDACSLVLDYGFKNLNLRKLFLDVFENFYCLHLIYKSFLISFKSSSVTSIISEDNVIKPLLENNKLNSKPFFVLIVSIARSDKFFFDEY